MKKSLQVFLFLILAVFLTAGNAFAIALGTNITISDKVNDGSGWHSDREDQEVEPGCVSTQAWDLEGFFLNGTMLTMVGGFDFENGVSGVRSGDIFFDTNGDAVYGPSNDGSGYKNGIVQNTFGYEYALSLDFGVSTNTYTVHKLDNSSTTTVYYEQNEESNPWRWASGGITVGTNFVFTYYTGQNDGDVGGLLGDETSTGTHNAVVLDLANFLTQAEINNFMVHFTMECGNDNLMGKNPVPEPASILLVGAGLVGLIGYNRKRYNKKI